MTTGDAHRDEGGTPLVKVIVEYLDDGVEKSERLWAKPVGDGLYEIRSTPWFVFGINWGDTVRCAELAADEVPRVLSVDCTSGHRTLRVIFSPVSRREDGRQEQILARLNAMSAYYERYNDRMVAVDVEPPADYDAVFDFLARCTDEQRLIFEEAWEPNVDGFGPTYEDTQPEPDWLESD